MVLEKKRKVWIGIFVSSMLVICVTTGIYAFRGKNTSKENTAVVQETTESMKPDEKDVPVGTVPEGKFLDVTAIIYHPDKEMEIPIPESDACDPSVSPEGSRIVLITKKAGKTGLAVAELPSGTVTPVTTNLDTVSDPSWNSDGAAFVFSGEKNGAWEIYLYDLKEKTIQKLTDDPKRKKTHPRVSPYTFDDIHRIAYVSEANGRKDIWWVRVTGDADGPMTAQSEKSGEPAKNLDDSEDGDQAPEPVIFPMGAEDPEWSPSGNLLICNTPKGRKIMGYSYSDWWTPSTITKIPADRGSLSWKPNQTGFLSFDRKTGKAFIIPADTLKPSRVLDGRRLTSTPAFFPDGRGFALTREKNGRSVLEVVPYDDPMGDVANLWLYGYSPKQSDKINKNKLLFIGGGFEQLYDVYETERYNYDVQARPLLVTSDSVLDAFYILFSVLYAQVERNELVPALAEFARAGAEAAHGKKDGKELENMFLTGLGLLKPDIRPTLPPEVKKEILNVEEAGSKEYSFFGKELDYKDFFIRGKYERDKDLQGYFRALKWFQAFIFDLSKEDDRQKASGIQSFLSSGAVRPSIEKIYGLYGPLVGESRYYTPRNVNDISMAGPMPDMVHTLPWIDQVDKYRIFAPVYTLDAHVFDRLVWHGGDSLDGRMLAKGLDIMAAFGSLEARHILVSELKENRYKDYERYLDGLTVKIGNFSREAWDSSVYQIWLDTLRILVTDSPEESPPFTQTKAWKRKQLNAALGSWVNLRYETIAIVEQAGAESGEGGYELLDPGKPRGYVEPSPRFFRRVNDGFRAMAALLAPAIKDQEVRKNVMGIVDGFGKRLSILETVAGKELNGAPVSDAEYQEIYDIGGTLEHFIKTMVSLRSPSEDYGISTPEPVRKIVDVQQDKIGTDDRLYEALGNVNEINVIVPFYGRRQIVKGPVYSYYEFTSKKNLDTAAWKKIKHPDKPVWIRDYFEGENKESLSTLPESKEP